MHDNCQRACERRQVWSLSAVENLMLWSMRAWVLDRFHGIALAEEIEEAMEAIGAPGAMRPLDGMMGALNGGASRLIEVNCVCCEEVSPDEFALLECLALAQRDRPAEAARRLAGLAMPHTLEECARAIQPLARQLLRAGHDLPLPAGGGGRVLPFEIRPAASTLLH
ncbi:hypothetical protein MVG78_10185 [Roseomonas gilardii subsp. gilardii]|uniref:hypothetical protein n=1 Tax=Roseomonas gilardii TaxID=257708 RepID=UPI001FF8EF88|nr:hypothetical protein [Roseomonas gilardii]UPG70995.1 hypothetical protein MVG78_10185 [Roseomonas gilardii subsp. gilardii]